MSGSASSLNLGSFDGLLHAPDLTVPGEEFPSGGPSSFNNDVPPQLCGNNPIPSREHRNETFPEQEFHPLPQNPPLVPPLADICLPQSSTDPSVPHFLTEGKPLPFGVASMEFNRTADTDNNFGSTIKHGGMNQREGKDMDGDLSMTGGMYPQVQGAFGVSDCLNQVLGVGGDKRDMMDIDFSYPTGRWDGTLDGLGASSQPRPLHATPGPIGAILSNRSVCASVAVGDSVNPTPREILESSQSPCSQNIHSGNGKEYGYTRVAKEREGKKVAEASSEKTTKKRRRTRTEEMDPSLVHTCPTCGKKFAKKYNQKIHEKRHEGDLPFICQFDNCGKGFMWQSSFLRHLKVHENRTDRPQKRFKKERAHDTKREKKPVLEFADINDNVGRLVLLGCSMEVDYNKLQSINTAKALCAVSGERYPPTVNKRVCNITQDVEKHVKERAHEVKKLKQIPLDGEDPCLIELQVLLSNSVPAVHKATEGTAYDDPQLSLGLVSEQQIRVDQDGEKSTGIDHAQSDASKVQHSHTPTDGATDTQYPSDMGLAVPRDGSSRSY